MSVPGGRAAGLAQFEAYRRRALGVETDPEADFAEWFRLTPSQARLLAALCRARSPQTRASLMAEVRITQNTITRYVMALREALSPGDIERGGYALTPGARAECARAVEEGIARLRDELRRAA